MKWQCADCGTTYSYELPLCSFCGAPLEVTADERGTVLAVTEVSVPSKGHEDVPYWCALVRTEAGHCYVVKADRPVEPGDEVPVAGQETGTQYVVGIAGTGVMGRGLVELLLSRGHTVKWWGRSESSLKKASDVLKGRLARHMDDSEIDAALSRLQMSTDCSVLGQCALVIEAVIEQLAEKKSVLAEIDKAASDDAIIATNTSGLSLNELASGLGHPERFGGLHFFNPPTKMRLVETVCCSRTSEGTAAFLDEFCLALGKVPVRVTDRPAFVVNRVLMPLLNEAAQAFAEGVAPAASIDEAVRLGLNHPMGPLALADLIGIDVVVEIMNNLCEQTGDERYLPHAALMQLVSEEKLGRKTGSGFYEYPNIPTTG